jgi:hypothetical protein
VMADLLLASPRSTGSSPSVSQTARPLTNSPTLGFGRVGRFRSPGAITPNMGVQVRGGSAPISQCVLIGEFALPGAR